MAGDRSQPLSSDQFERYSRQLILPEVGEAGQRKLLSARVLVIGAGGLGSPAAIYLAAAGIGVMGIVDGDRVDRSNLQRQILHTTADVGKFKTESAREQLLAINPDIEVITHRTVLNSHNAMDILSEYDVVINGCDNFPTRYLVNDACHLLRKPLVDASILRFEGQLTVYMPGDGCYRCLFPTPPPPGSVPNCAEAGIIGALAGHMGTLQAMEAIKIILNIGQIAKSRLIMYDALRAEYRTIHWRANENCPLCGDEPTIRQLIDYEEFCGVPLPAQASETSLNLDLRPEEAVRLLGDSDVQWIDVREPWEYRDGHITGARLIPLGTLPERLSEIDREKPAILICASGVRSMHAVKYLIQEGYEQVSNLAGGMLAWQFANYPVQHGQ